MKILHLEGLIAAPFTPMHPDGTLNTDIIPVYYEMLKKNGVRGAFICGSTGENVSLTYEEKEKVAEAWASAAKGDREFRIMTLIGGTCIADCISLAKHAESLGLYGVAFTAPFYFKPQSVDVLAEITEQIALAVPSMAVYYYHIPVLTGVDLPMIDLLPKVSHIPNFAGIKYTHEDFEDFSQCLNYRDGYYDLLWGRDETLLTSLTLGAKGGVGSTYNYMAPLYLAIIEKYRLGDMKAAEELQQQAVDLISLLGKYGGIATGKSYMKRMGLDCGSFRLPIRNMSEEQYALFVEDTKQAGFTAVANVMPTPVNERT